MITSNMKKTILIIAASMILINLVACSGKYPKGSYNTDGYSYTEIAHNQIAVGEITCLSKNGAVYIPQSINGKTVTQLGYNSGLGFGGGGFYNNSFYHEGEQVTISRYYCPNTITNIFDGYIWSVQHLKVFYCGTIIDLKRFGLKELYNEIYVPYDKFEEFKALDSGCLAEVKQANVSFMLDENTFYYVDYYETDSTIKFIPPTPQKDGYSFDGWYKDNSFTNKWNFETDSIQDDKKETKLYSHWIES